MRIGEVCLTFMIAVCVCGSANATVVNIDFEAGLAGDATYAGDDAALSSAGGTTWNSVVYPGATDLPDEFGAATTVAVELDSNSTWNNTAAGNALQDSGAQSSIYVIGLDPGESYTIAVYIDDFSGFGVEDAIGFHGFFGFGDPGADGWSLPGTEGNGGDYILVSGLQPFEVLPGESGFSLLPDGTITGIQISSAGSGSCDGDLDGDNSIGLSDLAILLANYGITSGMTAADGDMDGDGDVDLSDLAALLAVYGTNC